MNNHPFDEERVSENIVIRTFRNNTDNKELVWHRDHEDRLVEVVGNTNWEVQLDNELPQKIDKIFIPKNTYHRVIKGDGDLIVKVHFLK